MATDRNIEYILGKTEYKKHPQLACEESMDAVVRCLIMTPKGDDVDFERRYNAKETRCASWGLNDLFCFRELQNYTRLVDMPQEGIGKLAGRMYELLYLDTSHEDRYTRVPVIAAQNQVYGQILNELNVLQRTQRELLSTGKITFSGVTKSVGQNEL